MIRMTTGKDLRSKNRLWAMAYQKAVRAKGRARPIKSTQTEEIE